MNIEQVEKLLRKISIKHKIKILFAAENGSRAYGLNSDKSDFDLRLIYIHNNQEYYSDYLEITKPKREKFNLDLMQVDKIQQETITDCYYSGKKKTKIDWQGWDVTKAIKHVYELNPSIIEWLYSPIIYYNDKEYDFLSEGRAFIEAQNRLYPLIKHYKGMAKIFYKENVEFNRSVSIKKYMVAVRCCGMVEWLINHRHTSPNFIKIDFDRIFNLILRFNLENDLVEEIQKVIDLKKLHDKTFEIERCKKIDAWIREKVFKSEKDYKKIELNENQTREPIQRYNKLLYKYFDLNCKTTNVTKRI